MGTSETTQKHACDVRIKLDCIKLKYRINTKEIDKSKKSYFGPKNIWLSIKIFGSKYLGSVFGR